MPELIEAVDKYGNQYGTDKTYGCFVLFDDRLSDVLTNFNTKSFEREVEKFNQLDKGYIAGATQGAVSKTQFSVKGCLFGKHHTDWFFGGVSLKTVKLFMQLIFADYDLSGIGKAIIIDRQNNRCVITSDGKVFEPIDNIWKYISGHHQTAGTGGFIYYTPVVDNLKIRKDMPVWKRAPFNMFVVLRNYVLTKWGKLLHGRFIHKISDINDIKYITKDGGLLGKFLNEHGTIDDAESYLLALPEATSEQLLMVGTDICNYFHQTSVVVEDLNKNLCYFANGKKFAGKTKEEQKANAARNLDANARFLNNDQEPNEEELTGLNAGTIDEAVDELCRLAGC